MRVPPFSPFAALPHSRAADSCQRRQQLLQVVAPEPCVEPALQWAGERLDSAMACAPGVGRSRDASYAVSPPGWGDGRPGDAWFFARDALWTAFALLALGDFAAVRSLIAFLGSKQDPRGKVLHEPTSGPAHYDEADATPLYLLLVARYHAASGDLGFVRAKWTQVRAALAYCRSTDPDGDGVIENSRVAHGRIETDPPGGGPVTFDTAGIWAAALRELALSAEAIGERGDCDRLRADAERARQTLEEIARQTSLIQTVIPAVPLLLGAIEPSRMNRWLDLIAGHAFAAPIATGWTSWAEYTAGRTAAGFRHWWQNLLLCLEPEELPSAEGPHGPLERTAGRCPDLAWAAAMTVAPFVYGLLGFEPDAPKHRARLRPAIPTEWDALEVHNLRISDSTFSLSYARADTVHSFRLSPTSGAVPMRLVFEPAVIAHEINSISIDGVPALLDLRAWGDRLLCPLQIVLDHDREVVIRTEPP